jgi:hypothetical protein
MADELKGLVNDDHTEFLDARTMPLLIPEGGTLTVNGNISGSSIYGDGSNLTGIGVDHKIYVATDGNDTTGDGGITAPYLTAEHAMDSITDSSITNRYEIQFNSGQYNINNPLVLKTGVYLNGHANDRQSQLNAQNVSSNLIELSVGSGVNGLTLAGAISGTGIYMDLVGSVACNNITFLECERCIHCDNPGVGANINNISSFNTTTTVTEMLYIEQAYQVAITKLIPLTGIFNNVVRVANSTGTSVINQLLSVNSDVVTSILVENGAYCQLTNSRIVGSVGNRIGTAMKVVDTGSEFIVLSTYVQHADYGGYVDGDCKLGLSAVIIEECQIGLYTHTTGNEGVHYHGGGIESSIDWDMYLSESTATFIGSGMSVDEDKLYLDSANVYMAHMSTNTGDEGMGIKGELHVGSPERGSESVFGEGDSYTRGLLAYSYNISGSGYSDISTLVRSYTGSSFSFPNLEVDSAIYVSSDLVVNGTSDYHKPFGIKMLLTTAQIGGEIVAEYYNGSSWTAINTMTTQSGGSYYRKSDQLFTSTPGSYQVRYNPFIDADWAKSDDPSYGEDRYWIRYRITSTLTTAPIFEQWKLHSNRTELNADGFRESMGNARSYVGIIIPWNTFQDAGGKMNKQDLYNTLNTNAGYDKNAFDDAGDNVGTVMTLPSWVDTSAPLRLTAVLVSSATGTLDMKAFLSSTKDGDTISTTSVGSTVGEVTQTISKSVTAGQQITYEFTLDISDKGIEGDGVSPETIWVNLEADAIPGDVYGMIFEIKMLQFKNGEHV